MILLFTSSHCAWCEAVKQMISEVSSHFKSTPRICEINIDDHRLFADVFGISIVPTLVYKSHALSGLPDHGDLHSFLFQALAEGCSADAPQVKHVVPMVHELAPTSQKIEESTQEEDDGKHSAIVRLIQ